MKAYKARRRTQWIEVKWCAWGYSNQLLAWWPNNCGTHSKHATVQCVQINCLRLADLPRRSDKKWLLKNCENKKSKEMNWRVDSRPQKLEGRSEQCAARTAAYWRHAAPNSSAQHMHTYRQARTRIHTTSFRRSLLSGSDAFVIAYSIAVVNRLYSIMLHVLQILNMLFFLCAYTLLTLLAAGRYSFAKAIFVLHFLFFILFFVLYFLFPFFRFVCTFFMPQFAAI